VYALSRHLLDSIPKARRENAGRPCPKHLQKLQKINSLLRSFLNRRPDSFDTVAQHRLGERETQIIF